MDQEISFNQHQDKVEKLDDRSLYSIYTNLLIIITSSNLETDEIIAKTQSSGHLRKTYINILLNV